MYMSIKERVDEVERMLIPAVRYRKDLLPIGIQGVGAIRLVVVVDGVVVVVAVVDGVVVVDVVFVFTNVASV